MGVIQVKEGIAAIPPLPPPKKNINTTQILNKHSQYTMIYHDGEYLILGGWGVTYLGTNHGCEGQQPGEARYNQPREWSGAC